jgi:hypothetical protein
MLTPADVAVAIDAAIDARAPLLKIGATGIHPRAVLKAIAHVETEYGRRWAASRHEVSYCYGGPYYKGDGHGGKMGDDVLRDLTDRWGCSAHESWGPWQLLYITAHENGYHEDPVRLRIPDISIGSVITILNRRVFDIVQKARPEDVFDAWNSGRARDRKYPESYVRKAMVHYERLV